MLNSTKFKKKQKHRSKEIKRYSSECLILQSIGRIAGLNYTANYTYNY